ncbi:nucleotidyl transferase AbiEii/AbiGii toxin family protein [Micromonospora sp. NPDC005161]
MTARPTRATVGGRAYLDLQNLARRTGRPTDELHQVYALEGFLARLSKSAYADKLVLKGGVLLAAYAARRPTRDVDLQGRWISNSTDQVLEIVRSIAALHLDDGLVFDTASASAETIRDDDVYAGVRVSLTGNLSAARLTFHVDVNVGDPIWPDPLQIKLPRLLDGEIVVTGYPLPMVYAEKLVTALQRGEANTRWRDFADVYLLSRRQDIDGDDLVAAPRAAHRGRSGHRRLRPKDIRRRSAYLVLQGQAADLTLARVGRRRMSAPPPANRPVAGSKPTGHNGSAILQGVQIPDERTTRGGAYRGRLLPGVRHPDQGSCPLREQRHHAPVASARIAGTQGLGAVRTLRDGGRPG